jgi:hypothetical protein
MRYYFDLKDGDHLIEDDEGMELANLQRVQEEAARSLADMARDAVRTFACRGNHRMAIQVRDGTGPLLEVKFIFEIDHLTRH